MLGIYIYIYIIFNVGWWGGLNKMGRIRPQDEPANAYPVQPASVLLLLSAASSACRKFPKTALSPREPGDIRDLN